MLDLSTINFLVVEDNENMQRLLVTILRSIGVRNINVVPDAEEALIAIKGTPPDIIISDWMMQPRDGIEFTRVIRQSKDKKISMLPVIMLTSFSEEKKVREARDAGITEYVIKPISPKSIYVRITQIITSPRQYIRTSNFYGPDRRRHIDKSYYGEKRRKEEKETQSEVEYLEI